MSYINDALRKSQKEKRTRYVAYDHIVSASGKTSEPSQKWLAIIGILIVLFLAAVIIVFLYVKADKKVPEIRKISKLSVNAGRESNKKIEVLPQKTTKKVITVQEINEAKAFFAQALERQSEGELEEAKSLYKKVVKINPRNIQALNNLGVIYMSQKRYKWAIIRFNDAINIKPNYADAHYNLACLYAQKNDVAQSLFYLKNAVEFNPKVRKWAKKDGDLKVLADLPEYKKLMEKQ